MAVISDDEFVRLFQRTFGLKEDGWAGGDTVAKVRALAAASGVPVPSASTNPTPDDYWPMLSKIESGDRPYVKAPPHLRPRVSDTRLADERLRPEDAEMTNLLAVVDGYILPVIRAANRLRQARDRLPPFAWRLVPVVLREPVEALFAAVEAYERMIGRMIDAGLMPPTGTTPGLGL